MAGPMGRGGGREKQRTGADEEGEEGGTWEQGAKLGFPPVGKIRTAFL